MIDTYLIKPAGGATNITMKKHGQYEVGANAMKGQRRWGWQAIALPVCLVMGGCINLTAPEDPIVIELNINITQEVVFRLAEDASDAIEENADIF